WEYNPSADLWLQKSSIMTPSQSLELPVSFVIGNKAYVGTGTIDNGVQTNQIWEYAPPSTSNIYQQLNPYSPTTETSSVTDAGWTSAGTSLYNSNSGNVGIGTSSPDTKLHISGAIKVADGSQGAGKVLTSDANGLASWQTPANVSVKADKVTGAINGNFA